jgi:hypothetical protein
MDAAMSRDPPPRGGIAGLVLLFCFTAVVAGLGFDFAGDRYGFWLGARPGGAAALGAAAAAFCVVAAQVARLLLGRGEAKGSGDADPHP